MTLTTVELLVNIMYGTLTGLLLIFGSDILGRYFGADKEQRGDAVHLTFLVMGAALVGYGLYMVTIIAQTVFEDAGMNAPDWIGTFLFTIVMVILSAFALTAEQFVLPKRMRMIKIGQRKFGLIALLAVVAVIAMIVLTIVESLVSNDNIVLSMGLVVMVPVFAIAAIFALIGFYGFLQILIFRLSLPKEIKRKLVLGLVSAILALGGEIISLLGRGEKNELGVWIVQPNIYWVLGTLVEIGGFVFFRYFFCSIPPYSELDWKNGIIELHVIMADTGLSLYHRLFHRISPEALKGNLEVTTTLPEHVRPDSDLTGGAMIGIQGLLNEITSSTKGRLRNIVIGEKNLVFNQGNYAMVLLLADKNLGVYHSILYKLAREIEEANPFLSNFDGNLKNLKIDPIVDSYFGGIQTENVAKAAPKPAPKPTAKK